MVMPNLTCVDMAWAASACHLSKANPAQSVGQLDSLGVGRPLADGEGHDRGLDGLCSSHEQLPQPRNTKSHIRLASPCGKMVTSLGLIVIPNSP